MKKLLLLFLLIAGGVSTASATKKRIYLEAQNGWGRVDLYLYSSTDEEITGTWPGLQLTRIGTTKWFYGDVDSELTNARCIVSSNGWGKTLMDESPDYYEVDLSKNNVIYLYNNGNGENPTWDSEHKNVLSIQNFTGYVIANGYNASTNTLTTLTQNGLQLTGTLDLSARDSDTDFWVFPTILSESTYYVGNLAIRPSGTSDRALSAFTKYSDDWDYGDSYNWVESAHQKYDVNVNLGASGKLTFTPYRTSTIGDAGYITWSNGEKYTVEGATAYTVTDMGSYARLNAQEAGIVYPAGTGLVLRGSGEVTFNAVASDASTTAYASSIASAANNLLGSGNSSASIPANCYVLYWDGEHASSVGFMKTTAGTLGAHKAYLPAGGASAREFLSFSDETTAIEAVKEQKVDGHIYNLAGQRIVKPTKGLYIVNGKKVMK